METPGRFRTLSAAVAPEAGRAPWQNESMIDGLRREDIARVHEVIASHVVEPGSAAAFAAIFAGRYQPAPDEHVVIVLCGANTERGLAS